MAPVTAADTSTVSGTPLRPTRDAARPDDQSLTVTVVREARPSAASPLQVLLRRRLLALSLVFTPVAGLYTIVLFGHVCSRRFVRKPRSGQPCGRGCALYTLLIVTTAVSARILWSARLLPLRTLRMIEVVGFSILTMCEVWRICATWRAGAVFGYVPADAVGMTLLASRQSLIWLALIVAYGTFIPNTWRRCAAVVGVLAATPIVTATICNSLFGGLDSRLLSIYVFEIATWMLFASGLAIYGSHRIDVLRKEALEARTLGQSQLKRRLGAGGMGEVYLAEHLLLRRPCAIKLIRRDRAGDAESLLRFEREVQATATLTHANTVQVYDYGHTDDGTFYYAMQYLPGATLEELVQRHGPMPAARTIHLIPPNLRCAGRSARERPRPSRRQTQQHHRMRARRNPRCCETAGLWYRAASRRPQRGKVHV